jgi:hypothetical protein
VLDYNMPKNYWEIEADRVWRILLGIPPAPTQNISRDEAENYMLDRIHLPYSKH